MEKGRSKTENFLAPASAEKRGGQKKAPRDRDPRSGGALTSEPQKISREGILNTLLVLKTLEKKKKKVS